MKKNTRKPYYGSGKFSKGGTVHKTKASAQKVVESCKVTGIAYRLKKVKGGYRVDKRY